MTVDELDISTAAARSVMLTYFLLLATLAGGLYLAIDATAGERERGSLEPLLTLPVARSSLLLGKMAATICYVLASLALTLIGFMIALPLVLATLINVEPDLGLMWVPSLSQHLLVTALLKAEPLNWSYVGVSSMASIVLATLLALLAVRLYYREALLG